MTRQPVSHRGCWHKINGKATNTGIKLHSPRTGNPFPGTASPQTAPEATITASVTDYQPWHLPTAPPAAPTPCCIPRYHNAGSTFLLHNLRHTSHKTTFSPSPYNPEPSNPADANDGPLSLPGQARCIAAGFSQRQSSGHVQTTVVVRHCPAEVLMVTHRTHSTKRPVGCASQLLSP